MHYRRPTSQTITFLHVLGGILTNRHRTVGSVFRALENEMPIENAKERARLQRKLYAMRQKKYVEERDGILFLTDLGRKIISKGRCLPTHIPTPKKHDGLWHIVIFDIPQEKATERIEFVRDLKRLGLVFYQRSVWVYPYPLENEVKKIARTYGVLPHILFIVATKLDGTSTLRKHFRLPPKT